ncbi:MAG: hypothetical protein DVB31_05295 [Verrucomicrobia bacterium]|nr:MAG: hypothetical protein DVB31_05295 [Verrucomicrobiota bacterium]
MNPPPDPLDRLLRAAARAPSRPVGEASFAAETRALHAWRRSLAGADAQPFLQLWRAGLATAFALAVVAVSASAYAGHQTDIESTDPYTGVAQQLTVAINTNWQP